MKVGKSKRNADCAAGCDCITHTQGAAKLHTLAVQSIPAVLRESVSLCGVRFVILDCCYCKVYAGGDGFTVSFRGVRQSGIDMFCYAPMGFLRKQIAWIISSNFNTFFSYR